MRLKAVLFFMAAIPLLLGCERTSKTPYQETAQKLKKLTDNIQVEQITDLPTVKLSAISGVTLKDSLPNIDTYELTVQSNADLTVEIFTSLEKSGQDKDGWMNAVATEFNRVHSASGKGKSIGVNIRKIPSGVGYQYIISQKHLPGAFAPPNDLWIKMAKEYGIPTREILSSLVKNMAGVVIKKRAAKRIKTNYGKVDLEDIIDAVVQGDLIMGYTDPYTSSDGLNFLMTVLGIFANQDIEAFLTDNVIRSFEMFQRGVPVIATSGQQLRAAAMNDGSLDAFVMEYQTFVNSKLLQLEYEFIPFGNPHNNPLYAVGKVSPQKEEILKKFALFCQEKKYQDLAKQSGFNTESLHPKSDLQTDGALIIAAQKIWKSNKDTGKPIIAVFLADVSGSMGGASLYEMRNALLSGSEFINPKNSIGLVAFNDKVTVMAEIKQYNLLQKSKFISAIQNMYPMGNTAMYDGIAVSLSMLIEEKIKTPEAKTVLFVLTDGETDTGLKFDDMRELIKEIKIPIYTIGYNIDIEELNNLSSLVEASSLKADRQNVKFLISSLFNSQL